MLRFFNSNVHDDYHKFDNGYWILWNAREHKGVMCPAITEYNKTYQGETMEKQQPILFIFMTLNLKDYTDRDIVKALCGFVIKQSVEYIIGNKSADVLENIWISQQMKKYDTLLKGMCSHASNFKKHRTCKMFGDLKVKNK